MSGPYNPTPAEMGRMLEYAARVGPWSLPVLNAMREGLISLTLLQRDARAPLGDMRLAPLPMLAWIGDDDEQSCGPDGWRCALAAAQWARSALIHASGGEAQHYLAAVAGTLATGRLLLIETSSLHAPAWVRLLPGKPTLVVLPRGGVHPIASRETRH